MGKQATYLLKEIYYYSWTNACACVPDYNDDNFSACVCERKEEEERNDGKEKKTSLTVSENAMKTTHKTGIRRKK